MRLLAYPAQSITIRRGRFPMLRRAIRPGLCIVAIAMVWCGLVACSEQFSDAEDALGDTAERIEQGVLPPIVEETEVMLRNFVNFLPVLVEICATPIGELGDFVSQLPELQRAQQQVGDTFTIDDTNGAWQAAWRDVIFGDQDGQLSMAADAPSVDVTVTARFRNAGRGSVRAVPFALPSRGFVQTSRDPGDLFTCTETTPEGFYLSQDRTTGVWTLGWCAQGTDKVFQGEINTIGLTRISRKASSETAEEVASLTVNSSSTMLEFEETAAPLVAEGIRFFVRPGEFIDFELRMGPAGSDPVSITREALRIGADEAFLPSNFNPADFQLVTAVPIVPTGQPDFALLDDVATFVWQDDVSGPCTDAGETLWRVRFRSAASATFAGSVSLADDDVANRRLRVFRVGRCQQGRLEFEDDNERFLYECAVGDAADHGYDVCVRGARRLQFSPQVQDVRDPTRVWIGGENHRPSSQDPFSMFFDLEMEERQSARNLELTNGRIILLSTTQDGGTVRLREDQISLEALCRPLDDRPAHVRLIGEGEYATERFEGSRYDFDELEFTDALRTGDVSARRLPNRGELELRTRDESDTVEITVPAAEFADIQGRVTGSLDIKLILDTLELEFFDRTINLSLE